MPKSPAQVTRPILHLRSNSVKRPPHVQEIIDRVGGCAALARLVGVSIGRTTYIESIPVTWVPAVAKHLGITWSEVEPQYSRKQIHSAIKAHKVRKSTLLRKYFPPAPNMP